MVQDEPNFIRYFDQGTPERELSLLALGSRPARRASGNDRGIEDLKGNSMGVCLDTKKTDAACMG